MGNDSQTAATLCFSRIATAFSSNPVGVNVMNPMPRGRVRVEAMVPSSARACVRRASRFLSCVDSGLNSKPPPMKPIVLLKQ
jgi:hypothetical protein